MQYTESSTRCAKGKDESAPSAVQVKTVVEQVNDPRRKQGTRFSLASILLLALAAMLSNHVSELAIAQWGAAQSDEVKAALGFPNGVTPHQSTIQRLFRRLNADEVEAAFRRLLLPLVPTDQGQRGSCAVAIDGKAHRGRLKFEQVEAYPVHAVRVVAHQTGIVLTQGHVQRPDLPAQSAPTPTKSPSVPTPTKSKRAEEKAKQKQEEQKMKSELAVASLLLGHIDWNGLVLTGDALYCQRCLCHAIRRAGGDDLFLCPRQSAAVAGRHPRALCTDRAAKTSRGRLATLT